MRLAFERSGMRANSILIIATGACIHNGYSKSYSNALNTISPPS
jgi:hypothetical protein